MIVKYIPVKGYLNKIVEDWLKEIFLSQLLLKVWSIQYRWSDGVQQWCLRKECKCRANILPPLLLRSPGKAQRLGYVLDRADLLDIVPIAIGGLVLWELWMSLTLTTVLAIITNVLWQKYWCFCPKCADQWFNWFPPCSCVLNSNWLLLMYFIILFWFSTNIFILHAICMSLLNQIEES